MTKRPTTRCAAAILRCLPLLILLASCGDRASSRETIVGQRWIVEEELRIGQLDGPADYTFGRVGGVFPGPDGGLWVLESRIPELRLYDAEGVFVRRVGRSGSGPGEFSGSTVCAHAGPDGEIWVEDSAMRWQWFDISGALLGTVPKSESGCGSLRRWTSDGRMLAISHVANTSMLVEYRMSPDMDRLIPGDTFPTPAPRPAQEFSYTVPSGGRMVEEVGVVPFAHIPWGTLTNEGLWWMTKEAGRYAIELLGPAGEILRVIEHPYTPVPIPDSIRRAAYQQYSPEVVGVSSLRLSDVPLTYPPFNGLMAADDGGLWVRRQSGPENFEYDIFSAAGEYIATAAIPAGFNRVSILRITAEHLYGVYRDEFDVPYPVRFAIRRI